MFDLSKLIDGGGGGSRTRDPLVIMDFYIDNAPQVHHIQN